MTPVNLSISKEEEQRALQYMRKFLIGNKPIGKYLRKVRHFKPTGDSKPHLSDEIDYATTTEFASAHEWLIRIRKDFNGNILVSHPKPIFDDYDEILIPIAHYYRLPSPPLNEAAEISWDHNRISKEEEQRALQYLRNRKNSMGERIGRYLRKIKHIRLTNPASPDKIIYFNGDDGTTYTVIKNMKGELGFRAGYKARAEFGGDYTSDSWQPLNETAPTGDWTSWGSITDDEKNRLKIILKKYQDYVKKYYVPNLSNPKVYLIQKCIDNFGSSDPRFAAKALSHLGMENRLFLMDMVDHEDTTGLASRALDFLIDLSRKFIEPIKIPKPDLFLKGITRSESPRAKWAGDVIIYGLQDMKPKIDFGYGGYEWCNDFYKKYSKPGTWLYIDFNQDIKVVNMTEVVERIKEAIENYYKKNLTESVELPVMTKEEEQRLVQILKNHKIDGIRVGESLKKWTHIRPVEDDYHVADKVFYVATINGVNRSFKIFKDKEDLGIRDVITGKLIYSQCEEEMRRRNLRENVEPRPVLTKEEEQHTVNFIKGIIIQGERVGKTLKKVKIMPPKEDIFGTKTSNVFNYQAVIKNRVYGFYFWKVEIKYGGGIVIIGTGPDDYYIYWELNESKNNILKENTKEDVVVLTKEDEKRAVQFISNMSDGGIRLGKTLKKVKILKTSIPTLSSDISVYEAKLPDGSSIEFDIWRSWRRGLVIHNKLNNNHHFIDKPITFNHKTHSY